MPNGKLFLILGPSGSGKGVTIKCLRKKFPQAVFPVSCTTRTPRPGEKDGEVYHFLSREEFQRRMEAGDFLEYAVVHHDNYYGTLKKPILDAINDGKMVIREVDMQGVISIRNFFKKYPDSSGKQTVSIFITTSSWETLRDRIMRRHGESDEELAKRKKSYEKEMEFSGGCDYVVESREGELEKLCDAVCDIIRKEFADQKEFAG